MYKKFAVVAALLAGFFMAPAQAVVDTDIGVKAGLLSIDGDSTAAKQAGVVFSFDLLGMLGIEAELNTTVADGEFGSGVDYNATQIGAYGVLMTPGPFYFKAKAGFVRTDAEFTSALGSASDSDQDIAYGIGIGFTALEIEYTRTKYLDADVDMISASFKF